MAHDLTPRPVPVEELTPHPKNPNRGDPRAIARSLKVHGLYKPVVAQASTGRILAGNHTFLAAVSIGWDTIDTIMLDVDDDQALRIMLADNETARHSTYDHDLLTSLLTELADTDSELIGSGFTASDLDHLLALTEQTALKQSALHIHRFVSHVDCIFTIGNWARSVVDDDGRPVPHSSARVLGDCCLAIRCGWLYGINSSKSPCAAAFVDESHRPSFIDNDFKDYDHAHHMNVVAAWHPKYATVRDLMTEEQCDKAGVAFYTFDEVMDMAADASARCEKVIVIPKYDCLDKIPPDYLLGYSVPTTYGATPLPFSRFTGRPVHLLGGAAKVQLRYIAEGNGDVVSLDNNHLLMAARYGSWWDPETDRNESLESLVGRVNNPLHVAVALALGSIGAAVGLKNPDWSVEDLTDLLSSRTAIDPGRSDPGDQTQGGPK